MRTFLALLAVAALAGCAKGNRAPTNVSGTGRRIPVHVEIDTKGVPLGAYQIQVVWDRADAKIVEIHGTHGSDFAGKPNFDPATFTQGATRVTGYSTRQSPPKGPYRLVTVVLESVGGVDRTRVNVNVERLYDVTRPSPREIAVWNALHRPELLDFAKPQ